MSSEHNNPRSPIRIGSRGAPLALSQANHILHPQLTALRKSSAKDPE